MLGHEFAKDAKKTAVIVRDLYGLKSAGAAFRSHSLVKLTHIYGLNQKSVKKMK